MTPAITVDATALERPPRLADLRLLWLRELSGEPDAAARAVARLVGGVLLLVLGIAVGTALIAVDWRAVGVAVAGIPDVRPVTAAAGAVTLGVVVTAAAWWAVRIGRSARLSRWAADNRFGYARRLRDHRWAGMPFRAGRSVTSDVIASERLGLRLVLGRYRWKGERDRLNGSLVAFTFLQLDLPTAVPHLVLRNNRVGVLAGQGLGVRGSQRLSLEGDFDRSFQLFAPAGYERDALYVFAPDLMARVVDAAPGTEIEFVDDHVTVYLAGSPKVWRAERMRAVLDLVAALQSKLDRQTAAYRDDRAAAGRGGVALAGRRLRDGIPLRSVVIGILSVIPTVLVAIWLVTTFTGR